ncbi:hypothetical protein MASR2M8_17230 [Opitutaceae bacterium]
MPEIVVLLSFVGFVAYRIAVVAEKRRIKSPAELEDELRRLQLRHAWLRERIDRAITESWGDEDVRRLRAQLAEVERTQTGLTSTASASVEPR